MTKNICDGKTATEWRELAAQHARRREESFRRCDTDGFLSQWASGITSSEYKRKAEIAENGGRAQFVGLYEGTRRVKARMVTVPDRFRGYGHKTLWLLHDDETELRDKRGSKWLPIGHRSAVQKQLGLSERGEWAPATAKITVPAGAKRTGLSGCANAFVATFRTGDQWGQDAELDHDFFADGMADGEHDKRLGRRGQPHVPADLLPHEKVAFRKGYWSAYQD